MCYDVVPNRCWARRAHCWNLRRFQMMETLISWMRDASAGQARQPLSREGNHNYPGFETIQARSSPTGSTPGGVHGVHHQGEREGHRYPQRRQRARVTTPKGVPHQVCHRGHRNGQLQAKKMGCPGEDEPRQGVTYSFPPRRSRRKKVHHVGEDSAIDMALVSRFGHGTPPWCTGARS